MFSIGGEVEAFDLSKVDPIISGLLHRLPKPGSVWPAGMRQEWLTVLTDAFKLIYREDEPTAK